MQKKDIFQYLVTFVIDMNIFNLKYEHMTPKDRSISNWLEINFVNNKCHWYVRKEFSNHIENAHLTPPYLHLKGVYIYKKLSL
jgi:hypothetical protein